MDAVCGHGALQWHAASVGNTSRGRGVPGQHSGHNKYAPMANKFYSNVSDKL